MKASNVPAVAAPNGATPVTGPRLRAAQYVRMSTDHQRYSAANQSDANESYAKARGMEVILTYYDPGISGLRIDGRNALKQLIEDVQSKNKPFDVILVHDVSRWGRFQDIDESAYYEYICRRAGVDFRYCAEPFENDGSPLSAIAKGIKRLSAAEYSRDLSVKVFAAQRRLVELGYRQGGQSGYGLRRLLISASGEPKGELKRGETKNIFTDRIVLVPGEPQEVRVIRWIFDAFVRKRMTESEIAQRLNKRDLKNATGRRWTGQCVGRILVCEKYIGNNVWNKSSLKLKGKLVKNEPGAWVRAEGVFEAIVTKKQFDAARRIMQERLHALRNPSQEERLSPLRRLFKKHGYLSVELIRKTRGTASASSYTRWFGSMPQAYQLVGFNETSKRWPRNVPGVQSRLDKQKMLDMLRRVLQTHGYLSQELINNCHEIPCSTSYQRHFGKVSRAYELIGYSKSGFDRRHRRTGKVTVVHMSDGELLQKLRLAAYTHGNLTARIIEADTSLPSLSTYRRRFGSLLRVYKLIGFVPSGRDGSSPREIRLRHTNYELLQSLKGLLEKHGRISRELIESSPDTFSSMVYIRRFGSLTQAYRLIGYRPPWLKGLRAGNAAFP
jgi:DNA invertase Pin-like site-specific DNA recombinase